MLAPDQRELFLDALRPPEGYQFDRGIATTFTLDLLTLLVASLSLALLEVSDSESALNDPVVLLEGVRRHADRLSIFCQAGRIAIPPPDNYLYSFLEKSIVEVQAPRGGVFHPKVWLLRYVAEAEEHPPLYRLLSLSRNLTFDKSWDLMLRLEGHLATHRQRAYGRNNPLGNFVQQLPELAVHPVEPRIAADIALLQDEVRRVAFRVPWPFRDDLAFYPLGIPGCPKLRLDRRCDRMLVVSPFLSDRLLRQLTEQGERHVMLSRAESIDALKPKTLDRFERLYVLDDPEAVEPDMDTTVGLGEEVPGASPDPSGLHAKLFVKEAGWNATWLVGSANATNAAFRRKNVEFMIELQGRKSKIGIDKVLGEEGDDRAILSLLRAYRPSGKVEVDEKQKQVEAVADRVRDWLVDLKLRLDVAEQDAERFDLVLYSNHTRPNPPQGDYSIACWPVTLHPEQRIPIEHTSRATALTFPKVTILALTSFIAFEVSARVEDHRHALRFVLNLPISGIPQGRSDRLFSAIISEREQFLRYLWLILSPEDANLIHWIVDGTGASWDRAWGSSGMPLLEMLMRALSRSPEKIDRIADLVEGLRRTPEGREVLPEGFEPFWEAVTQTRSDIA